MFKFRKTCVLIFVLLSASLYTLSAQGRLNKGDAYKVVINHEEQYSIWPVNQNAPKGWDDTKVKGDLKKCQNYIEEVWTDMRPLSIRKKNLPASTQYSVVINHEEQYSILPSTHRLPTGWKSTNFAGNLTSCNNYIEEVWTDMRPLSIRSGK